MRKTHMISLSTKVSKEEYATITAYASQRNLSLAAFIRLAALTGGELEPVYCEDDRRVLLFLRDALRQEGCRLTDLVRTLNIERIPVDLAIKSELIEMQRTIAALCVELSIHRRELLKAPLESHHDAA